MKLFLRTRLLRDIVAVTLPHPQIWPTRLLASRISKSATPHQRLTACQHPRRYYATMTTDPLIVNMSSTPPDSASTSPEIATAVKCRQEVAGMVVLAPMVRTGELPTRLLALEYGADLVWGPETVDKGIIGCTRHENPEINCVDYKKGERLIYRTCPAKEKAKHIFQIGTADAELAVEAAKVVAEDIAGIDVNAGCPKHFSVHAGMGAGLLKNPTNLISILKALISNVGLSTPYKLPVSVKIRLLSSIEETHSLIKSLCDTGISRLTLHCRTIPMRPRERAIRDAVAGASEICRSYNVKFFINGDVENRDHAMQIIKEYNIDGGAMIALAAESNPAVFLSKKDTSKGPNGWRQLAEHYLKTAMSVENAFANTKFCLLHFIPGKAPEYQKVAPAKTYREMCEAMRVECIISEQKDLGTTKTQRQAQAHKVEMEKQLQAKLEKQERMKRKAEEHAGRDVKRRKQAYESESSEKDAMLQKESEGKSSALKLTSALQDTSSDNIEQLAT